MKFVVHVVQQSDNCCEVLVVPELVMLICYSQSEQCSLSTVCICGCFSVNMSDLGDFY